MTDKERLEEIKSRVWKEHCTYAVGDDSSREGYQYILSDEDYHWLLEQVEHRQKLLERLNKRGIEIKKLKKQLCRCREKIKNLEWNLLITKGTADQSMRANKSNYELANKLEEENKRLRRELSIEKGCRYNESYVRLLEIENKRLCEALEFYADEKSWMNREVTILMDGEPTDVEDCPAIFDDGGNIARKALEGEE